MTRKKGQYFQAGPYPVHSSITTLKMSFARETTKSLIGIQCHVMQRLIETLGRRDFGCHW